MRKENKESENREKELKERQTKRAEQMAKVNGPKDIVDETNFKRLGFQIIRTEFATGLYGKFYKAKKDGKELVIKLITLDSKYPLIYKENLLN